MRVGWGVGSQGKLGGQVQVPDHALDVEGVWFELVGNISLDIQLPTVD